MQRLFLSLLICLGFVLPATAQAWWQDDWHYRKQIAVDTTPQGAAINQALGRTALICLVVPPLVFNRDNRGLHDLAFGTIALRR